MVFKIVEVIENKQHRTQPGGPSETPQPDVSWCRGAEAERSGGSEQCGEVVTNDVLIPVHQLMVLCTDGRISQRGKV